MQKWQDIVLNQFGGVVKNATVKVYNAGLQTSPTIYSDNGTSTVTSSQVTADALGRYSFYAADGRYDLSISGAGITGYTESDVLLFDPAASTGALGVGFIQSGTGASARTVQTHLRELCVSVAGFTGADSTGVTVSDTAFINAIATGKNVYVPPGTWLLQSQGSIQPVAGQMIFGAGMGVSIIKVQATVGVPDIAAISQRVANVTVRDLTLQMDVNGQTKAKAVSFDGVSSNINFDFVEFKGTTVAAKNWGLFVNGFAVTGVFLKRCKFSLLEECVTKANADASAQANWNFIDCDADSCTDVLNINSPAGSWLHGTVRSLFVTNITQFPVAFAGASCAHWDVQVQGHDTNYELVHCEAGAWDIDIHVSGYLTNKTAGTVGSAGATNGMVQIITGCHDIRVNGSMDLTQNTAGSPNGLVVQAGGGSNPYDISLNGATIHCKSGCTAVYGQNVGQTTAGGMDISNCTIENQSGSKSAKLLDLPFTKLSGINNKFINPGVVLNVDDNSYGGLMDSTFLGDVSTLTLMSGSTSAATSVVFQNFTAIGRAFNCDAAANWQDVFPDGSLYGGVVSLRYIGNGAADSFTKTARLTAKNTVITIADEQANSVGGVDPMPGAPHWRSSGGKLQSKAFRATLQTGQVVFTFQGAWYP